MTHTHTPKLQTLFNFTDDDLAANRQGQLSQRQQQMLKPTLTRSLSEGCAGIANVGLFILCPSVLLLNLLARGGGNPNLPVLYWGLFAVFTVMLAIGVVLAVITLRATIAGVRGDRRDFGQDVADGTVLSAVAEIVTDEVGEHIYAKVDGDTYLLHDGLAELELGSRWQVYYTPNSYWIVSIEAAD
jgi:hypothetical protein